MTRRVLVLVEGQTEERFVKDVLSPSYIDRGLYITPTLLVTKRVKDGPNFKGGVTHFANFASDLTRLLQDGEALVTTLLDYYGLPADFPGMASRSAHATPRQRAQHVEGALKSAFAGYSNFEPFLALHEFEAWLFCDPQILPTMMGEVGKVASLVAVRDEFSNPENINERPDLAPSKRIMALFPSYRKVLHGPTAVSRIGLDRIREECEHFASWISMLDAHAGV